MSNFAQLIALPCALVGALSACATPPAQDFERLCTQEAGLVVYERARLPAERFTPDGRVIELKGHPENTFGPDYMIRYTGSELSPDGRLRKSEAKLFRNSDGKLMAVRTRFIKKGQSVLGFEPKVYSCPATYDSFNKVFFH